MASSLIHTQFSQESNAADADIAPPDAKKSKATESVLTFSAEHAPHVKIQLLSTNTIHDLVDTLCNNVPIGTGNEKVYDHMWNIMFPDKQIYESGNMACESELRANQAPLGDIYWNNTKKITLRYDYGALFTYCIIFCSEQANNENKLLFPRREPIAFPSRYVLYETANTINLNTLFPNIQKWAFGTSKSFSLNLFQPGRKQNFAFFSRRGLMLSMLYLPCKPTNLVNWLSFIDQGAKHEPTSENGHLCYDWHSVVILPEDASDKLCKNYEQGEEGFIDVDIAVDVETNNSGGLERVFPRIAALAGVTKKAKNVPKGWISYQKRERMLCIYTGPSRTIKSNAPKGTAFDGENQHQSADEPLLKMEIDIQSLHELFCVVEGLLRTLG